MRPKNLPPDEAAKYQRVRAKVQTIMDGESMTGRNRVEHLAMMCVEIAKVEGSECLDFVEGVFQAFYEDQEDTNHD
jgi:hypothetical protein